MLLGCPVVVTFAAGRRKTVQGAFHEVDSIVDAGVGHGAVHGLHFVFGGRGILIGPSEIDFGLDLVDLPVR